MDRKGLNCEALDVSVKVGCKVFSCHRSILLLHSKYFECLFSGYFEEAKHNTVSLPAEYVDEKSFSKLLDAMYGESLTFGDDLPSLLIACSYLDLTMLTDECVTYMMQNLDTIDLPRLIVLPQLKEYTLLYAKIRQYVCRHFSEFYAKMIRIPFELVKELLKNVELLLFSREHALEFSKLWLRHFTRHRKIYRKEVSHLSLPFRHYHKACVVNHCKQYMKRKFDAKDMTELFLTFKPKEKHPLYDVVKKYICKNFCDVPLDELQKISYPLLKDLFTDLKYFDMGASCRDVCDFSTKWVNYEENRGVYREKVFKIMLPFHLQHLEAVDYDLSDDYNYYYDYDIWENCYSVCDYDGFEPSENYLFPHDYDEDRFFFWT